MTDHITRGRRDTRPLHYAALTDTVQMTVPESDMVRQRCRTIVTRLTGTALHDDRLLYAAEHLATHLPSRLRTKLLTLRDRGNVDGALLIKGLPIGELDDTPHHPSEEPAWWDVPVASLVQLSIMSILGSPISYAEEKAGQLIQDVYPQDGAEQKQENSGSVLLELHTEDGFLRTPPDYLSLLCLRSDHERRAATVACGIRRVLTGIPAEMLAILRRPRFQIAFSSSFVADSQPRWTQPLPVLTGPTDDPNLCVDLHGMVALDDQAEQALNVLQELMEANLVGGVLEPGELLIVDNNSAVHGRTDFTPHYDGRDRWLRRCFVTNNLRRVRADIINGRMLRSRERDTVPG
ncbi:clavaminate synthase family protein [Prauserella halophila]|uniref:Clavaminate synthase family protein n=1 Tax=Prauserella halophila TaxID=185641 RepID=A0ABN1W5V6_9PSEU|nr:TauD/TfdA family dioxygenase [Prauserella halophila]MCP2235652.1 L-asparagine oxygenase [Prauserella halophila]